MTAIPVWTYEPLTDEEIKVYWNTLTEEEKIEEIRKLDILEHSLPVIEGLEYIALLTEDGDLIIYPKSIINLSVGYLSYEITMPQYTITEFIIPEEKKNYLFAGIGGTVIALIATGMAGEENWIKYCINVGVGLLAGLVCEYIK